MSSMLKKIQFRSGFNKNTTNYNAENSWVEGDRFVPRGAQVQRHNGSPRANDHASYRNWLQQLFIYAGTLSLRLDSETIHDAFRPGDFFVDVGANIGYYTLLASQLLEESGLVLSLEPEPKNFELLRKNVDHLRAANVQLENFAAHSETKSILVA